MGTRNAIVKSVAKTDLTDMCTAISNNHGTLCTVLPPAAQREPFTEICVDFPSDADGVQFEVDITGVGGGYTIHAWDLYPLLRQTKTMFV